MINPVEVISSSSILLPILFGIFSFQYLTREFRLLFWLCCAGLFIEGFSYFGAPSLPTNLKSLNYYFWDGFEFIVLMKIFCIWSNRKIFIHIGFLFLVFHAGFCFVYGFEVYDTTSVIISSIIIAFSVFLLFRKSLDQEDRAMSVVFAGLFLYFSINLFVYSLLNNFSIEMIGEIWKIHTAMNILMNISFVVGFYIRKRFVQSSINSGNVSSGYQPHSTSFN